MRSVAEVVYIPIYVAGAPENGVQAVMEIMVSSNAWEAMVVANLISFVSSMLTELKVLYPGQLPAGSRFSQGAPVRMATLASHGAHWARVRSLLWPWCWAHACASAAW